MRGGEPCPHRVTELATTRRKPNSAARRRKLPPPPEVQAQVRQRADGYRAARRQNASEVAEDYVELIDDLIQQQGEARSVDMAARLGVSHVTVAKTIQRLHRDGLVRAEPYRAIFLTPTGRALAADCRRRHELVVNFLKALGVDEATAERDAEGIEHHISARTFEAMTRYLSTRR